MSRFPIAIKRETVVTEPVVVGDAVIRPEVRIVRVQLPGAAYVRAQPAAIIVEQSGNTQRLSVRDLTRQIQLVMLLAAVGTMLLGGAVSARRKDANHGYDTD